MTIIKKLAMAGSVAAFALATPAFAAPYTAPSATGTATVRLYDAITLDKVTDVDFGVVIRDAAYAGGSSITMVRLGTRVGPFDLASATTYQKLIPAQGKVEERLTTELLATARVGAVRLRGSAEAEILPFKRLRTLGLDAYWSKSENTEWNAGIRYDSMRSRSWSAARSSACSSPASIQV